MRALSSKAVTSQESILKSYANDFVSGIKQELQGQRGLIDIAQWFSMATFDVISDLAFSKSFNGLQTGTLHPWISVVFGAFKALPLLRVIREIPGVRFLGWHSRHLLPKTIKQRWLDHFYYGANLIDERFESGEFKPDMIHYLISEEGLPLTRDEIKENAVQMVTAGSEPVSNPLS